MAWFKKSKTTPPDLSIPTKQTKKLAKKAEKIAKKTALLAQKEGQTFLKSNTASPQKEDNIQRQPATMYYALPQIYTQPQSIYFVPITLLIQNCYNQYCLEKLLKILQILPTHSQVFLEHPHLVDRFCYEFTNLTVEDIQTLNTSTKINGHFVATIDLTTIDIEFLTAMLQKIYQYPFEVYLFCNKKLSNLLGHMHIQHTAPTTNATTLEQLTEQTKSLLQILYSMPFYPMQSLFMVYAKGIANRIFQLPSALNLQWKSNFLPLFLTENICFLKDFCIVPPIPLSMPQTSLETEMKEYLKLYKLVKSSIYNNERHVFFYKVIESRLMLYYAKLIVENRLDKLEKFDSALQKNYFVFYIGLAEHSPMRCIQKLRKKCYKVDFITKFFAKQIVASAKKASK